jgi:hypothetical protein
MSWTALALGSPLDAYWYRLAMVVVPRSYSVFPRDVNADKDSQEQKFVCR